MELYLDYTVFRVEVLHLMRKKVDNLQESSRDIGVICKLELSNGTLQ